MSASVCLLFLPLTNPGVPFISAGGSALTTRVLPGLLVAGAETSVGAGTEGAGLRGVPASGTRLVPLLLPRVLWSPRPGLLLTDLTLVVLMPPFCGLPWGLLFKLGAAGVSSQLPPHPP